MKTKKSVVTKMLDFVRKAAVRNAGLPSTRGMHEPEVPKKIFGGGVESPQASNPRGRA